jgi:hypothetical protein
MVNVSFNVHVCLQSVSASMDETFKVYKHTLWAVENQGGGKD